MQTGSRVPAGTERGAFREEGTGREPDQRHGSRRLKRWARRERERRDTGGEAGRRQTRKGFEELLGGQVVHTVLGRQMETNGRLGAEG